MKIKILFSGIRKILMSIAIITVSAALISCGTPSYTKYVSGNAYLYEKDGDSILGGFKIEIKKDGSYVITDDNAVRFGKWEVDGDTLTLESTSRTNFFVIQKKKIVWIEENSDNFENTRISDGAEFIRVD